MKPSWINKVNAERDRVAKNLGVRPKYHLHGDPREHVAQRLIRRGLVTFSDEGERQWQGDGAFRFVGRILKLRESKRGVDRLAAQADFAKRIADHAEGGKVAVVHGGRDCDGVEFHGLVHILPATAVHVDRFLNEIHECAEGPTWWNLERPSVAEGIESSSRDLTMEAFENGHPHVLRP